MSPEEEIPVDQSRAAFNDKLDEFYESLITLYIKKNSSGRIKFSEKWPVAAKYIFGDELIGFDTDGVVPDQWERRSELEEEAEERRLDIKLTIVDLKEKTSKSGVLQFDYVGEIIDKYGVLISQYFYTDTIIERVRPGLLANAAAEQKVIDDAAAKQEEADVQLVRDLSQAQHDEKMAGNPEEQSRYEQAPVPAGEEASKEMPEAVAPDASDDAKLTDVKAVEPTDNLPESDVPVPPEKDAELVSPTQDEAPKPEASVPAEPVGSPAPPSQPPESAQTVKPKDISVPDVKPIDTDKPNISEENPSDDTPATSKPEAGILVKQFNLVSSVTEAADPS